MNDEMDNRRYGKKIPFDYEDDDLMTICLDTLYTTILMSGQSIQVGLKCQPVIFTKTVSTVNLDESSLSCSLALRQYNDWSFLPHDVKSIEAAPGEWLYRRSANGPQEAFQKLG